MKKNGILSRLFLALVFLFLYAPILVLIAFSFNDSKSNAVWGGFTLDWYVQLLNNRTYDVFYNKLTFIYLEMPKFNKPEDQLSNLFEKWLFVLRNLSRLLERPKALQERVFAKLFKAAEIAKFTKEEYDAYEESLKVYRDWKNTIDTAVQKAVKKATQKAREEGREEGRKETAFTIARQLKSDGLSTATIAKATGLTEGEINAL